MCCVLLKIFSHCVDKLHWLFWKLEKCHMNLLVYLLNLFTVRQCKINIQWIIGKCKLELMFKIAWNELPKTIVIICVAGLCSLKKQGTKCDNINIVSDSITVWKFYLKRITDLRIRQHKKQVNGYVICLERYLVKQLYEMVINVSH